MSQSLAVIHNVIDFLSLSQVKNIFYHCVKDAVGTLKRCSAEAQEDDEANSWPFLTLLSARLHHLTPNMHTNLRVLNLQCQADFKKKTNERQTLFICYWHHSSIAQTHQDNCDFTEKKLKIIHKQQHCCSNFIQTVFVLSVVSLRRCCCFFHPQSFIFLFLFSYCKLFMWKWCIYFLGGLRSMFCISRSNVNVTCTVC